MEKEFVPYEQALDLKELGFNEKCGACYYKKFDNEIGYHKVYRDFNFVTLTTSAPTFSQAFRWFREKYNLYSEIDLDSYKEPYLLKIIIKQLDETNSFVTNSYYPYCISGVDTFNNKQYEEAELECLKKLIGIVKNGENR